MKLPPSSKLGAPLPGPIERLGTGMSKPGGPARASQPVLGTFEKGGDVKKTGLYQLEKGEKVTPAADGKRDSEYRRVYLKRKNKDKK